MFMAMNRFKVVKGEEVAFERIWASRDTYLNEMPGFMSFHLLRGPEREEHTLYASHTTWASRADFIAWTESEQFMMDFSERRGILMMSRRVFPCRTLPRRKAIALAARKTWPGDS
jgi:heme-degrading monooxygenase HmoA